MRDSYSFSLRWNRSRLAIHLPTNLTESLEREDLGKYTLVAVFPLLVSVTGHLVQMLWRSICLVWMPLCILIVEFIIVALYLYHVFVYVRLQSNLNTEPVKAAIMELLMSGRFTSKCSVCSIFSCSCNLFYILYNFLFGLAFLYKL